MKYFVENSPHSYSPLVSISPNIRNNREAFSPARSNPMGVSPHTNERRQAVTARQSPTEGFVPRFNHIREDKYESRNQTHNSQTTRYVQYSGLYRSILPSSFGPQRSDCYANVTHRSLLRHFMQTIQE